MTIDMLTIVYGKHAAREYLVPDVW